MKLVPKIATTVKDAESMRVIRNSCRLFMTHDQSEISEQKQAEWWVSIDRSAIIPFLFLLDDNPVGYGILRVINGKWWCSGGLLPEFRRMGLGSELFSSLINKCPSSDLWLDVWGYNQHALKLYRKLGFEIEDSDYATMPEMAPLIVVMKHTRPQA